jgi:hypothetical protein
MAQTHYYYALNRKAAELIFDLTWNQFLQKFGWRGGQWETVGGYFYFCLNKPSWSEEPTPEQVAPILRQTVRETVRRMEGPYFCISELSYYLGKRSFIRAHVDAERLEADVEALIVCAISAFLFGDIDARTLWSVLTLHWGWWSSDFFGLTNAERRRINAAIRPFGSCRPRILFDWQPASALRNGHTVLFEEDTRRFARFLKLAWRKNWPVYQGDSRLVRFRTFELARRLHAACPALPGNCLLHYLEG